MLKKTAGNCRIVMKLSLTLMIFSFASLTARAAELIAILGAFPEEIRIIKESLTDKKSEKLIHIEFTLGMLNGKKVVVAETGIGKVNAAAATAVLLEKFHPEAIIFSGIAGGVNPLLKPGDIIVSERLAQHDYGIFLEKGFTVGPTSAPASSDKNPIFFKADPALISIALNAASKVPLESTVPKKLVPAVRGGTIVTGDAFIAASGKCKELRKNFSADATEMEGAAIAQIAYQNNVPFVVIRSMSDNADDSARTDMDNFYKIAAKNSAAIVMEMVKEYKGK